ncbi:MAG: hypothetical protein ABIT71_09480, partial [Vicinamibacteraceae bacterium]
MIGPASLALALAALLAQAPAAPKPATTKPPAAATPSRSFADLSAAAAAARDAGRMDDAIGLYRQAIALRADWNEGRWYLGSALYERERYAEC